MIETGFNNQQVCCPVCDTEEVCFMPLTNKDFVCLECEVYFEDMDWRLREDQLKRANGRDMISYESSAGEYLELCYEKSTNKVFLFSRAQKSIKYLALTFSKEMFDEAAKGYLEAFGDRNVED